MSNWIRGVDDAERIGTNGSSETLCALLFAGYGVGLWPGSERVQFWVDREYVPNSLEGKVPLYYRYLHARDRREYLWKLIDCNVDNCTWIRLARNSRERTVDRGLKLKDVDYCPILRGLVIIYEAAVHDKHGGHVGAGLIRLAYNAVEQVLPNLTTSCWYPKLKRVSDVLHHHRHSYVDFT